MIEIVLVLGLATWRISSMLASERGPLDIFKRLRESFGVVHDQDHEIAIVPEKFMALLISCVWCNSVYVGAFWTISYLLFPQTVWLAMPFALSAIAVFLEKQQ